MNLLNSVLGSAIGDAMGVPYEFLSRGTFECKAEYKGYGTWPVKAGTYSDDTAMLLCTLDCIRNGYSKDLLIKYFIDGLRNVNSIVNLVNSLNWT